MSQENVPPGYEAIPLGEALNGPSQRPVMGAEGKQMLTTLGKLPRGGGGGGLRRCHLLISDVKASNFGY